MDSSDPGQRGGNTGSQLLSTLVPVLVVAIVFVTVFLFLRRIVSRTYSPRTMNLPSLREQERSPKLSDSFFGWFSEFMAISDLYVLNHQNIDSYLLLRYLKISSTICLVGCLITWPVLFPVNATGGGNQLQLNVVSFTNIDLTISYNPRLYAHTFVGWIFFSFVWYMIARETIYYINIRHAYLLSPLYANRMSSRTVLYAAVPQDFLDAKKLRQLFGDNMKNFWISTDTGELDKLVKERDGVAMKLEAAENKLIKLANKKRLQALKKGGASNEEENAEGPTSVDGESGSVASRWVDTKDRPTHRLKPLVGKKVDTINWCRQELERLIPEVRALQAKHKADDVKHVNSVIIEFHTQAQAQAAYQTTTHHHALHMAPRYIGINPEEIIWSNLRILWWERVVRNAATIAIVCALIIFWAIPVAFVGILSNIDALISGPDPKAPFLSFLNAIPSPIFGVVKGLLPSVLLAVLMALLPIFLRLMAKLGGAMSSTEVELTTQNFYYAFQVVQVFLVATLASAATTVVPPILDNPASAASLLAANIPQASNLYITYFIVQGISIPSGAVLQLVGLILFRVLGKILDNTPRKMYKRWITLSGLGWGTLYPVYTLLVSISLIYSCIAPLMMGFASIALYLFYLAFRYNILFVFNTTVDTRGRAYARALQHTTVGIYIGLVCMIGLFGVGRAPGPAVLTLVYLIFSVLFHVSFRSAVAPLIDTLPKSLEVEEDYLLRMESGANGEGPSDEKNGTSDKGALSLPAPHKKPNFFTKWLHPEIYTDYQTLRRMVPRDFAEIVYDPETERNAYYNPSVVSEPAMLWIPKDSMGISAQEVAHTSKVIPISDENAAFDDKGNLYWDQDTKPPIYEEKVYY